MDIQKDVYASGKSFPYFCTDGKELYKAMMEYWGLNKCSQCAASLFYNLGRIHGIRDERARRKKTK